jgi:hypothetical protein
MYWPQAKQANRVCCRENRQLRIEAGDAPATRPDECCRAAAERIAAAEEVGYNDMELQEASAFPQYVEKTGKTV